MRISDRKLLILKAIVDDYIMTGTPVGSRTLAKREELNFSPATIRNEMADLEEEGYLEQPHTSAGRRPSDKAYRLYVDTLMKVSALNPDEIRFVHKYLEQKVDQVNNVVEATADTAYHATNGGKYLFPEMKCHVDETAGTITFVGNAEIIDTNLLADGLFANIRFEKDSNASETATLDFQIQTEVTEFYNWSEVPVTAFVVQ